MQHSNPPGPHFSSSPFQVAIFSHPPGPRGNMQEVPRLRLLCAALICNQTGSRSSLAQTIWALTSCLSSYELPAYFHYLTAASLWSVRAPRLCFVKLSYLIIPGLSGLVVNLLTQTPKSNPISTITAHSLGNLVTRLRDRRLSKVQEIWEVRLEVFAYSREGQRQKPTTV